MRIGYVPVYVDKAGREVYHYFALADHHYTASRIWGQLQQKYPHVPLQRIAKVEIHEVDNDYVEDVEPRYSVFFIVALESDTGVQKYAMFDTVEEVDHFWVEHFMDYPKRTYQKVRLREVK